MATAATDRLHSPEARASRLATHAERMVELPARRCLNPDCRGPLHSCDPRRMYCSAHCREVSNRAVKGLRARRASVLADLGAVPVRERKQWTALVRELDRRLLLHGVVDRPFVLRSSGSRGDGARVASGITGTPVLWTRPGTTAEAAHVAWDRLMEAQMGYYAARLVPRGDAASTGGHRHPGPPPLPGAVQGLALAVRDLTSVLTRPGPPRPHRGRD
jgi:hypothetical protein